MPAIDREKTKYPGVYSITGTDPRTGKPEKIFYIVYRKDGRQIEEKTGRAGKDGMTAARVPTPVRRRYRGGNLKKRGQSPELAARDTRGR